MIEIRELYKYYGEQRALGPVSAEIGQGEIVGLLGVNGAGKSFTENNPTLCAIAAKMWE